MTKASRWVVAAAVLSATVACGKDKPKETGEGTGGGADDSAGAARPAYEKRDVSNLEAPDFMAYIPADSPIVWASYKPLPKPFIDKMAEAFGGFGDIIQKALDEDRADGGDDAEDIAVMDMFDGKFNMAGLASVGIKLDTRWAMYMVGASLVGRVELADGAKLSAFIEELAKKGGKELPRGNVGGQDFYRIVEDDVLVAIAIQDGELVAAMLPVAAEAEILPVVFKQQKPAKSIVDTGALKDVVAKYGFAGYMPGYFDVRALAKAVSSESSSVAKHLGISMSPACASELMELAEVMPRWVFGYTNIDGGKMTGLAVAELRKDIAADMKTLAYPVPGLQSMAAAKPMMAFGAGVDMGKTLSWIENKAGGITAAPYQCEFLDWINEGAVAASEGLGDAPPLLKSFKGGLVVLDEFAMGGMMPKVAGYGFIGVDEPMELVGMGKAMDPSLGKLDIKANGKPVKVPAPAPGLGDIHVAVKNKWLGVSVGGGKHQENMTKVIATSAPKGGPFFVIAYDYGRFLSAMGDMMEVDDPDLPPGFIKNFVQHFGLLLEEFYFEDQGIVVRYEFTFR